VSSLAQRITKEWSMKERPVLRSAEWPEQDRIAFADAFRQTANPFIADAGAGGHLRERTVAHLRQLYGYWLGFLAEIDRGVLAAPPGDRVTAERIRAYGESLGGLQPVSRVAYVKAVYDVVRHLSPGQDWRWLRCIVTRLERVVQPVHRPLQIDALALRQVGLDLIGEAQVDLARIAPGDLQPLRSACERWRDGLFIALAITIPLRRANLAGLHLAETLQKIGIGWRIEFAPHQAKTGRAIEATIPGWLGQEIDTYVAHCRPRFPKANHHASLWPSWRGTSMTDGALYAAFVRGVRHATGIALRLHDIRAIAATSLVIADPASASAASPLLGHADARVTQRHYVRAGTVEAARLLSMCLENRRTFRSSNCSSQ
jgi:integrase